MAIKQKKVKTVQDVFDPLFQLIAEKGWENYSSVNMAEDLKLSRLEFYKLFSSKQDILSRFTQFVTEQVIASFEPSATEKDSLFDLLMLRFETMKPYKLGLTRLYNETVGHATPTAPAMLPDLMKACAWMVGMASSDTAPFLVHFKAQKLLYIYLMAYKVWIRDTSEDLDLTLVEIDRRLEQVKSFQEFFSSLSFPRRQI